MTDATDNCVRASNSSQEDTDGDGVGNACNDGSDADGDEWSDDLDNCPQASNPGQEDANGDGVGDICDHDLTVARIELIQSIQDRWNSVPIVAGKDAWARVYVDIGSTIPVSEVTGRLRFVDRTGAPLATNGPGAPAGLVEPTGASVITVEGTPDRGTLTDTLNFLIPRHWFWLEEPYISVQVSTSSFEEANTFNNSLIVPFNRQAVRPLNIVFVPIRGPGCWAL